MNSADSFFEGFAELTIDVDGVVLNVRSGGKGPPLVLLHGYPQTQAAWHRVAPALAEHFTVVAPDLRGYGRSGCPPTDSEHRTYGKRTMARDIARLMERLGHGPFAVIGHDRGGRVAYRLALDRPDIVRRLVVVDIIPTYEQWQPDQHATRGRISHWAFLAQPAPIPETLIGANPLDWLQGRLRRGNPDRSLDYFEPRALASYRANIVDPDRIHANCEDYRAGASCDLADDTDDRVVGRRIEPPTLLLVATQGSLAEMADPLVAWQPWCRSVDMKMIESGHFIAEENPQAFLASVLPFLMHQSHIADDGSDSQ